MTAIAKKTPKLVAARARWFHAATVPPAKSGSPLQTQVRVANLRRSAATLLSQAGKLRGKLGSAQVMEKMLEASRNKLQARFDQLTSAISSGRLKVTPEVRMELAKLKASMGKVDGQLRTVRAEVSDLKNRIGGLELRAHQLLENAARLEAQLGGDGFTGKPATVG